MKALKLEVVFKYKDVEEKSYCGKTTIILNRDNLCIYRNWGNPITLDVIKRAFEKIMKLCSVKEAQNIINNSKNRRLAFLHKANYFNSCGSKSSRLGEITMFKNIVIGFKPFDIHNQLMLSRFGKFNTNIKYSYDNDQEKNLIPYFLQAVEEYEYNSFLYHKDIEIKTNVEIVEIAD